MLLTSNQSLTVLQIGSQGSLTGDGQLTISLTNPNATVALNNAGTIQAAGSLIVNTKSVQNTGTISSSGDILTIQNPVAGSLAIADPAGSGS